RKRQKAADTEVQEEGCEPSVEDPKSPALSLGYAGARAAETLPRARATIDDMPRATSAGAATPRVVLFHGEERFLVEQKARELVDVWAKDLVSDLGLEPHGCPGLQTARLRNP